MLSAAVFNTLNAVKELIRRYLGVITANTLLHRERLWSGASALVISPTRGSLGPRERGNREREREEGRQKNGSKTRANREAPRASFTHCFHAKL